MECGVAECGSEGGKERIHERDGTTESEFLRRLRGLKGHIRMYAFVCTLWSGKSASCGAMCHGRPHVRRIRPRHGSHRGYILTEDHLLTVKEPDKWCEAEGGF